MCICYKRSHVRRRGVSLPLALPSTLSTSRWPDLARIHLSQDPGKQSLQSQPPEMECRGVEGIKIELRVKGPRLAQKYIHPCIPGNCHLNKTNNKCFCDLRWVTSSLMWSLNFNMFPRILTLPLRTQALTGSLTTTRGQIIAP